MEGRSRESHTLVKRMAMRMIVMKMSRVSHTLTGRMVMMVMMMEIMMVIIMTMEMVMVIVERRSRESHTQVRRIASSGNFERSSKHCLEDI